MRFSCGGTVLVADWIATSLGMLCCLTLAGGCSSQSSGPQRGAGNASGSPVVAAVELPIPVKLGMTWDQVVPMLSKEKRIRLVRDGEDAFTDVYRIAGQGYSLRFERPPQPAAGPYRLVRVEHSELPRDPEPDLSTELRRNQSMDEALPTMQRVGGYFTLETKDRFVAVLQANDGTYRVTFQRPQGVGRPEVIANASAETMAMMGRIPLNALPEFGDYRITAIRKTK